MSPKRSEFINAIGVPLYEGYGLSETAGSVSVNRPGANRIGTVGRAMPGFEVKLAGAVGLVRHG